MQENVSTHHILPFPPFLMWGNHTKLGRNIVSGKTHLIHEVDSDWAKTEKNCRKFKCKILFVMGQCCIKSVVSPQILKLGSLNLSCFFITIGISHPPSLPLELSFGSICTYLIIQLAPDWRIVFYYSCITINVHRVFTKLIHQTP